MTTTKLRAVGYVRVSTEQQVRDGSSIAAQVEALTAYCKLYGLELLDIVIDAGQSAKNLKRPGITKVRAMLADARADGVVVCKLDRLTRSVKDLGTLLDEIEATKSNLWSVNEHIDTRSPAGRMVLTMIMTVSQWEREEAQDRTRRVVNYRRGRNLVIGKVPYGQMCDGDTEVLVPNPAEVAVIAEARELAQTMSLRKVSAALTARGRATREGKPFAASVIARLVA